MAVRGHERGRRAAARASSSRSARSTEVGRIAGSLATRARRRSPLQRELDRLVRILLVVAIALIARHQRARASCAGNPLGENLLAGISAAIAAIPEEPPILLAVILGLGAYRLLRRGVLVRRLNAEETLGAVDLVVTDKTGHADPEPARDRVRDARRDGAEIGGHAEHAGAPARRAARRGRRVGPRGGDGAGLVHRGARTRRSRPAAIPAWTASGARLDRAVDDGRPYTSHASRGAAASSRRSRSARRR